MLFAVLMAGALVHADEAKVMRVRADSWMPFNGNPGDEKPGYVVELLREIFEPLGIKVDYQTMPWTDALKAAASGEVDAVLCADATESAQLFRPKQAIAEPQYALFVRRTNAWHYGNVRSLDEVKLGAVEGDAYWQSLDAYLKRSTVPAVTLYSGETPIAQGMTDLVDGQIDVMVESTLVFYWHAKKAGYKLSDFRIAYSETANPLFVAFTDSEAGRKLARQFDLGLNTLKQTGRFTTLLEKYGISN